MPASEPLSERPGRRVLTVVFWAGVGLAPLAALLLLVGQSAGALRVAAVLAVLAVVLIGLSITLRRDAETARLDMEETLLEEVDMLREDVRNDIATAARATHKAFGEKLQALHETVQALRAQVEMANAGPGRPQQGPAQAPMGHHDQSPGGYERPGMGAGPAGHAGMGRASMSVGPQQSGPASMPGHVGGRAHVPGGVVRHTETVQVTTRQTIVDPHGDDPGRGTVYGGSGGYGAGTYGGDDGFGPAAQAMRHGDWAAPPAPPTRGRRAAEPDGESWSDQRRDGQRPGGAEPHRFEPHLRGGDGRRPRPYDRADQEPADDGRWTGMRAGDRWTSVRSDDRGREVRMGERRAAMHADESGSEMRIEDRWAAVRQEEPRRDDYRREAGWRDDYDQGGGRQDGAWSAERWDRRGAVGARPAGEIEPTTSWGQQWSVPERESVGRRRRYRDEDDNNYH